MLAPPPEGTFDVDSEILPIKDVPNNNSSREQVPLPTNNNSSPEQVPLLTNNNSSPEQVPLLQKEEVTSAYPNPSNKGKVWVALFTSHIAVSLFLHDVMIMDEKWFIWSLGVGSGNWKGRKSVILRQCPCDTGDIIFWIRPPHNTKLLLFCFSSVNFCTFVHYIVA